MKNRFHLEQEIIDCWKVVDDLQQAVNHSEQMGDVEFKRVVEGLFRTYNMKFDIMFDTFKQAFGIDEYRPEGKE